jgi:hypothetical protein
MKRVGFSALFRIADVRASAPIQRGGCVEQSEDRHRAAP